MSNLRNQIEKLSSEFVSAVLSAMGSAPLNELAELSEKPRGGRAAAPVTRGRAPAAAPAPAAARPAKRAAGKSRRRRATADEVQAQKDLTLATAKKLDGGFSKSDVMKKAGSREDLGRALSLLVNEGKLTRKGERRLARYWVK